MTPHIHFHLLGYPKKSASVAKAEQSVYSLGGFPLTSEVVSFRKRRRSISAYEVIDVSAVRANPAYPHPTPTAVLRTPINDLKPPWFVIDKCTRRIVIPGYEFSETFYFQKEMRRGKRNTFLVSVKEKQAGRAACILVLNVLFVE